MLYLGDSTLDITPKNPLANTRIAADPFGEDESLSIDEILASPGRELGIMGPFDVDGMG